MTLGNIRTLSLASLLWTSLVLAAPIEGQESGFDVNDVSVLFPLNLKRAPVPEIPLSIKVKSVPLLEEQVLKELLDHAGLPLTSVRPPTDVDSFSNAEDWSVVGFRYDPCAPDDDGLHQGRCNQEIRLVAQPITRKGPADSALHLIYTVGYGLPKKDDPILKDLLAIKRESHRIFNTVLRTPFTTDGVPLGVHPLILAAVTHRWPQTQGMSPLLTKIPKLYKDFILKHAKANQLTHLTLMGLRDGSETGWIFLGGQVNNHHWTSNAIPNLPPTQNSFIEFNRFPTVGVSTVNPIPLKAELSTAPLFIHRLDAIQSNGALRNELSRAIHTIENPHLSNRNTVDCLSCHTSTALRIHNEFNLSPFEPGITVSVPHRITGYANFRTLQYDSTNWNLRSFGFFSTQASLSLRTVHESAIVAEQLNQILNLSPPGRDCSQVERKVFECFNRPPFAFGFDDTPETCLSLCRK